MDEAIYSTKIFEVNDVEQAKRIILTPEEGTTTEGRWNIETPYLMELIRPFNITENSIIVDYGCGIGRMAKPIIERYGAKVIGVDISMNMRALANVYVNNKNFTTISHEFIPFFKESADVVIAIWTLQHCFDLDSEIKAINYMLKPFGKLFVANERIRLVPTDKGWVNDQKDIFMALQTNFITEKIDMLDPNIITEKHAKSSFYGIFSRK